MGTIKVNFNEIKRNIKPHHSVNNGPSKPMMTNNPDVYCNVKTYTQAGFPYARTHDPIFYNGYGGKHTVDVRAIFKDWDKDPYDPNNYDFDCTDDYMKSILSTGTQVFYRLGASIEHEYKKYYTLPPLDNQKYAVICEHIIRHLNEGWGNGHHFGIEYWEIWNEPDLDKEDSPNKRCWGGTEAQFHDFYEVIAKHLKTKFPSLKIGGPSLAGHLDFGERFIDEMARRNVPMDFFSWHSYMNEPSYIVWASEHLRKILNRNGYENAEIINAEFNYGNYDYEERLRVINNYKGACLQAATMCACQDSYLDMLMYYDARPNTTFNGMWNFYTLKPKKTWHVMCMFNKLYRLGNQVNYEQIDCNCIYGTAAKNAEGKGAIMFAYYKDADKEMMPQELTIEIEGLSYKKAKMSIIDKTHNASPKRVNFIDNKLSLIVNIHTTILIEFE